MPPVSEAGKKSETERREGIIANQAKKDAQDFMRQLLADMGVKQILPGRFDILNENYEKIAIFLGRLSARFPDYGPEELSFYIDEFYRECNLGYPKILQ